MILHKMLKKYELCPFAVKSEHRKKNKKTKTSPINLSLRFISPALQNSGNRKLPVNDIILFLKRKPKRKSFEDKPKICCVNKIRFGVWKSGDLTPTVLWIDFKNLSRTKNQIEVRFVFLDTRYLDIDDDMCLGNTHRSDIEGNGV